MPRVTELVDSECIGVVDRAIAMIPSFTVDDKEESPFDRAPDIVKGGYEAADQLWYVLILREIEQLQANEFDYVDCKDLNSRRFLGQAIDPNFVRERAKSLGELKAIELAPSDGGIAAVRLTDKGRKSIREHSWLEFAGSDVDSI